MTETATQSSPFIGNMLAFTGALRRVGLRISLKQSHEFLESLQLVDVASRQQVYFAARGILVTQHEDYPLFDQLFDLFWRDPSRPAAADSRSQQRLLRPRSEPRKTIVTMMAARQQAEDPALDIEDRAHTFSAAERLFDKDFSQMSPEELEAIKRLIQQMQWKVSLRVTRRLTPDRGGSRLDLRRMMRNSIRTGGVPLHLAFRARKIKTRPIVVLADISGSM